MTRGALAVAAVPAVPPPRPAVPPVVPRPLPPVVPRPLPPVIPGWEGSIGPFPSQYGAPHVYARDVHSGAGNCVCGRALGAPRHVQAAPGVPIPDRMRP